MNLKLTEKQARKLFDLAHDVSYDNPDGFIEELKKSGNLIYTNINIRKCMDKRRAIFWEHINKYYRPYGAGAVIEGLLIIGKVFKKKYTDLYANNWRYKLLQEKENDRK